LSENAISNVKKGANVIIKPLSLLKEQKSTALNSVRKKQGDDPERQDFDRDGEVTAGFASSIIPTLEEQTIFERRPSQKHVNGKPLFDAIDEGEADQPDGQAVEEATVPNDVKPKSKPKPVDADHDKGGTSSAAKIYPDDGETELYGAPANATDEDDDLPNQDTAREDDQATEAEQKAVKARQTLRKHLAANVGVSPVCFIPN
jgi:phospholipase D1/2